MKEMQNLYQVRKSLRFELLKIKKSEKYKFEENILKDWINNSFQIIKNQICTLIYNNVVFDIKPAEKK